MQGIGSLIGKSVVAGTVVATAAITGLVKKSVEAYSEFEQLEGGLEALFGKGSKNMQNILKTSEDAYKTLTMSQNQYLKAFEGSYSIINNGIGKNANAIEYTNKMISMSTDLYNTYGGTVEQYQGAINWALKGTYSYLDNLNVGIKGTKEGFIEAANKSGILKKNISDTSELTNDQILDVIQHYVKAAGALGRTQKEASETIQGSMNMMKSSWENLIAGFSKDGANLNKLIDQFVDSAGTFVNNLIPVIERALVGVINVLPKLFTRIGKALPGFIAKLIPPLINAVNSLMTALTTALPEILTVLTKSLPTVINALVKMVFDIIQAVAQMLPKLLPQLLDAILDGIMMILDNIDVLIDCGIQLIYGLIDGIIKAIPVLQRKAPIIIVKLVAALVRAVPKLLAFAATLPLKIWAGMVKNIPTIVRNAPKIIRDIIKILKQEIPKLKSIGVNIVKGLWKGAKDMKKWVVDKFKGLGKGILGGMKKALGIKSPSKEFMKIGEYSVIGYYKGIEKKKPELKKALNNLTVSIQKQIKGKSTNYKKIGQLMGKQLVNGLESGLATAKDVANKLKENLSNVDLLDNGNLTNLAEVKNQIVQYGNNLKKLRNKIPKNLYTEILGMDREEGLEYTSLLLSMGQSELKSYINNWNAIQKQSKKISDEYYNNEAKNLSNKYKKTLNTELSSLKKLMNGLGKKASKGLISGMLSESKNLSGVSKTLANNVIKSLKKALKIKSPSRVMAELGQYTTEGYIEGIASMKNDLGKMINDTFSLSPSMTGTMNNTLSPNVNVVNNVNVETDPLGQVVSKIKTFSGGAKNDYNYGMGG